MTVRVCLCKDSQGTTCYKYLTKREAKQDGMCSACADMVWHELQTGESWVHDKGVPIS